MAEILAPLHVYRFDVTFNTASLVGGGAGQPVPVCEGAFSECTGLDATMEPKEIKEGGRNYGSAKRAGPVTFGTVVLKRGITNYPDLWNWFKLVSQDGKYAYRLTALITVKNSAGEPVLKWQLKHCLPTKFKTADLNASGNEVGIEELHLVHEGLTLE